MALSSCAAVRRLVETLGPASVCTQDDPALKGTPFWERDQKVTVSPAACGISAKAKWRLRITPETLPGSLTPTS
ncbi:unnamed protein product [Rangifer tarandus platyrhynchus]|uniref:Uncharacterized protein n=1 Tax=Rangifer tarandus platyrhynchus TaxID=3082113 RepID=A0AC59ZPG3_RANTA